jgi:GNAT superfamily N-acetyltransferase
MWRTATESDDDAIVAMCLALYEEDPAPAKVESAQVRRTLAALRREPVRGRALVLDIAGCACGYALLVSFWSNEVGGELCTVDELFVAPEHRGRGHGSRLLQDLAGAGHPFSAGAVAVALEVTDKNRRAQTLYQRLGFVAGNRTLRRPITRG